MRRRRRVALVGFAVAATASAVAAALLTAPTSHADTPTPYFATTGNGSDPHIINCTDPDTGYTGWCLYTSVDMGQAYSYTGNSYPMRDTKAYFSTIGSDTTWTDKGVVFQESTIDSWTADRSDCTNSNPPANNKPASPDPAGNCNAYHLWAPSAVKDGSYYYLFVPDVSDVSTDSAPNIHTSSRVAVSRSTDPFGPFTYLGEVDYSYGYMSDPEVLISNSDRVLVWADGDHSTCGGFQSALMNSDWRTFRTGTHNSIVISGVEVLGSCDPEGSAGPIGRPYMEGASVFKIGSTWNMFFAAKPTSTPAECASGVVPPGNPSTANEVIARATASSPQGPYTYQGIVMCGSKDEWTNQATVTVTSSGRQIIVYHDAGTGTDAKQRNLHAECLFTNGTVVAGVYRQALTATNGFNDCIAGTSASYWGFYMKDAQVSKPTIIRAPNDGTALKADRYAVGPWERYKRVSLGSSKYAFQALSNGKYLCTPNTTTAITASCTSTTDTNAHWYQDLYGGLRLLSVNHDTWVSVGTDGSLYADATSRVNGALLTYLYMGGKSS